MTTFTKKAIGFTQTDRTGWTLNMTVDDIIQMAPAREPEQLAFNIFGETNRPITSRHLESIERFLEETPDWAVPAIILAADPGNVSEKSGRITAEMDEIRILDGQHRIQAFSNVVHEMQIATGREDQPGDAQERLAHIRKQELPVVILHVKDKKDQRQIFAWFARNRPIEPAVREYFDESDPFGKAAKAAMEDSRVLDGNVTYKVKTVPPRDREFLSLNNLKEIAITIQLGIRRAPRAEDRAACWERETQEALQKKLLEFFDDFLPSCKPNYEILSDPTGIKPKILQERSISHTCHPLVVRLIANAWARWTTDYEREPEKLARYIGQLKLKRADPLNDLEDSFGVVAGDKKKFQGIRHKSWEDATALIIRTAQER